MLQNLKKNWRKYFLIVIKDQKLCYKLYYTWYIIKFNKFKQIYFNIALKKNVVLNNLYNLMPISFVSMPIKV